MTTQDTLTNVFSTYEDYLRTYYHKGGKVLRPKISYSLLVGSFEEVKLHNTNGDAQGER